METQPIVNDQTTITPPVVDNVVIEGGAKKKKCKKGSRRGSDGKCHSSKPRKLKYRGSQTKSRGGVCGNVSMKLCKMSPQCQYVKGHQKKGSKPARKGYCKSRPMEEADINKTIQGLFEGGELEAGKRSSRGSISKLQARAKKLCVKASGSKAAIRQRIKSAKKSKKAISKRCARKNM